MGSGCWALGWVLGEEVGMVLGGVEDGGCLGVLGWLGCWDGLGC